MRLPQAKRNNLVFSGSCAIIIVLADQLSKFIVLHQLQPLESVPVVKNIFHLTLVLNTGIAFGLFKNQLLFYLALPLAAITYLTYTLFFSKGSQEFSRLYYIALSLILGGAIGNLIDRIRFGQVVDFLDFRVWPVFNLADSAITIGVTLIVWTSVLKRRD